MYPLRLALEICVERAGDDARVLRPFVMQADKVLAVQDQDRPLIAAGFRQNLRIWNCFFGSARISNRQHLMSQPPKRFDYGQGEFSFVYSRANYASSFSWIWCSISSRCART